MSDQADRERESRESDITKFEEIRLADESEREETAQRLLDEQKPEPEPEPDEP